MLQVSQSIEEFDEKIEKLRKEKRDKWKKEFEKNSGKSEAHLQQVKATNREITEAKVRVLRTLFITKIHQ